MVPPLTAKQRKTAGVGIAVLLGICLIGANYGFYTSERRSNDIASEASQDGIEGPGLGSFMFSGAEAVRDNPVRVWYIAPEIDPATTQILVVIPGAERDAESYRSDWEPLVEDRNVLVLVPEFPETAYSDSAYNLGNVMNSDGNVRPRNEWTFVVIEALFDYVKADVKSEAQHYNMFGHSAGAQFVHRFMQFMDGNRVGTAVAANAGWYTVPDESNDFPYGLNDSPLRDEDLGPAFASNLIVMLGADDNDSEDDLLRHNEETDAQGANRLERGLNYYLVARHTAEDESLEFRWQLRVVPGIDHDHTEMAKAAADLLIEAS